MQRIRALYSCIQFLCHSWRQKLRRCQKELPFFPLKLSFLQNYAFPKIFKVDLIALPPAQMLKRNEFAYPKCWCSAFGCCEILFGPHEIMQIICDRFVVRMSPFWLTSSITIDGKTIQQISISTRLPIKSNKIPTFFPHNWKSRGYVVRIASFLNGKFYA